MAHINNKELEEASLLLPLETKYPVNDDIMQKLGMF